MITKKTLLATSVAGVLSVAALPAHALDAEISGHLNRAILAADNGENSDTLFVDGEPSNTRIRFVGSQDVSPDLKAGVYLEWEYVSNNSSAVDIGGASTGLSINERHFDASLAGDWGKVSLGQGNGAANGAMEVDLSGTAIAGYSSITDVGGSLSFVDNNGAAVATVGQTMDSFDFLSRYDRIRYDTPSLGPITVAIATGNIGASGDGSDVAVRYSGDLDGSKLAFALGYSVVGGGGNETMGGSASLLLEGGFNVTVALGNEESDDSGKDADNFYTKVGYKSGQNAFAVDFGTTTDNMADGVDGEMIGVQYVHKPIGWMELYAAGKVHSVDGLASNPDDISVLFVGTRIKF